jgi:hypothetical protein
MLLAPTRAQRPFHQQASARPLKREDVKGEGLDSMKAYYEKASTVVNSFSEPRLEIEDYVTSRT